ncbi:unnamed protein product [Rotaria sp. Silwood2]|nr:unnamed protein product [Rotaria sp. Silwood2]CAF4192435.1 unnamed protein product [Rotaria sp. Silwood2]
MSLLSDACRIASLNDASTQLNRYFGIFIFLFGIVGNALNTCVLSQRPLRSNPCAWLFLVSSISNSIGILAGLTSRPLSTWSADLTTTNQFLCKLRAFLLYDGINLGSWLIMLATIDRWLSSNINAILRQRSTMKNAQVVDITETQDFNKIYELYDPCTVMFFYCNQHIMIDLGTGNNNKISSALEDTQEFFDIVETVYRRAQEGRGLVISLKDYSTKYHY